MRALATTDARIEQLRGLWESRAKVRQDSAKRNALRHSRAIESGLLPQLPEEDLSGRMTPLFFGFLPAALAAASHVYRVEPDRESEDLDTWRRIAFEYDGQPGWLTSHMRELDKVSRLHGSALAVLAPEFGQDGKVAGFGLRVFDPSRFVALAGDDDRVAEAVLIHWHASSQPARTEYDTRRDDVAPTPAQVLAKQADALLAYTPVDASLDVWLYLDSRVRVLLESSATSAKPALKAVASSPHTYGFAPFFVLSRDQIQTSLDGEAWGGSDLLTNLSSLNLVLSQTGENTVMQRGQPHATGTVDGSLTLSPKHVIRMKDGGQFGIAPAGNDPRAQLDTSQRFVSLTALHLSVPVSSVWRDRDPTDADSAAAELVLSADRPESEAVLARAERRTCELFRAAWKAAGNAELAPWKVVFKRATPPSNAYETIAKARLQAEQALQPRIELAAQLNPELPRDQLIEKLQQADRERAADIAARVAIAGHAQDVSNGAAAAGIDSLAADAADDAAAAAADAAAGSSTGEPGV